MAIERTFMGAKKSRGGLHEEDEMPLVPEADLVDRWLGDSLVATGSRWDSHMN